MKKKPFSGIIILFIILVLLFILGVTIGLFYFLYLYSQSNPKSETIIANMQASTLAISAISITLVSGIVTILTFYREKKIELLNLQVENDLKEVKKEKELISKLIYLQSNNSRYLLRTQYDDLVKIGNELCDENNEDTYENKSFLLYTISSILETYATQDSNINSRKTTIYSIIIHFATNIVNDNKIKKSEKINALYMRINAHYRIFRNDFELSPDTIDDTHLSNAIDDIQLYESEYKEINSSNKSATESNLAGLVYYWKFNFNLREKTIPSNNDLKNLQTSSDYFSDALTQNNCDEQIHNNFGCCLMGMAKYHYLKNDIIKSQKYYEKSKEQFYKAIKLLPSYEKPYINLIDICCNNIKALLNINKRIYLLSPFKSDSFLLDNNKIISLYEEAVPLFEKAKQSGKMLYNVYYKIAELKTYRLLIAFRENKINDIEYLKEDIIKDIANAIEESKCVKVLMRKRQFYELCEELDEANKVNDEISELDEENANQWIKLIESQ